MTQIIQKLINLFFPKFSLTATQWFLKIRLEGKPRIAKYNAVSLDVMKENGIEVLDLYTPSLTIHPENSKPGNVHYTDKGYELLAEQVINKIKTVLK